MEFRVQGVVLLMRAKLVEQEIILTLFFRCRACDLKGRFCSGLEGASAIR